jgi:hypothetical protein
MLLLEGRFLKNSPQVEADVGIPDFTQTCWWFPASLETRFIPSRETEVSHQLVFAFSENNSDALGQSLIPATKH